MPLGQLTPVTPTRHWGPTEYQCRHHASQFIRWSRMRQPNYGPGVGPTPRVYPDDRLRLATIKQAVSQMLAAHFLPKTSRRHSVRSEQFPRLSARPRAMRLLFKDFLIGLRSGLHLLLNPAVCLGKSFVEGDSGLPAENLTQPAVV
jgi:hypothetical protein